MTNRQRNLFKVFALLDAIAAIVLLVLSFAVGINIPIIVPIFLMVSAVGLFFAATVAGR